MRTIKRQVQPVAAAPLQALRDYVDAANHEKAFWLGRLRGYKDFACLSNVRKALRDPAVKAGYVSPNGLSARQWKSALDEAVGMADRFWQAHFSAVRSKLAKANLSDARRHYCFSILCDYAKLFDLFEGRLPALPAPPKEKKPQQDEPYVPLTKDQQIRMAHCLRAAIRKNVPSFPRVKLSRSAVMDQNQYRVTTRDGVQYASVATLVPRQRVELALKGFCATPKSKPRTHKAPKKTDHYGTARLVIDSDQVALHTTAGTDKAARAARKTMTGDVLALDAGYTDTFADQHGDFYGRELGTCLLSATDALHDKGVVRNRLRALEEKYRASGNIAKANAIRRCNLGTVKQTAVRARQHATVECIINTAMNQVLAKKPRTLVREHLSKTFAFKLGRQTNRRLSAWTRGRIVDRCDYKAHVSGSDVVLANAAYSSQACRQCGWVEQSNRQAHAFKCRKCGHGAHAGTNAARNLVMRPADAEIRLHTPHGEVKRILLARYQTAQDRVVGNRCASKGNGDCCTPTLDPAASPTGAISAVKRKRGAGKAPKNPAGDQSANG